MSEHDLFILDVGSNHLKSEACNHASGCVLQAKTCNEYVTCTLNYVILRQEAFLYMLPRILQTIARLGNRENLVKSNQLLETCCLTSTITLFPRSTAATGSPGSPTGSPTFRSCLSSTNTKNHNSVYLRHVS